MRLKSIGVLRGYAMGKTQLSKIADNIEREVEEALESERSENARMQSELEFVGVAAYLYGRSDIKAENAKLRELVRIAVQYCDSGTCDGCPIMDEDESCPYSDMARELGVEVD